uniref:Integrase n=1 Tax=Bursaphelenchus xylophilus TaxID=6326 RepID=A0A1I7SSG5_BURXY
MKKHHVGSLRYLIPFSEQINAKRFRKFDKVKLDDEGYKKVHNLHVNWYITSIKALMGELGKDLYKKLDYGKRSSRFIPFEANWQGGGQITSMHVNPT